MCSRIGLAASPPIRAGARSGSGCHMIGGVRPNAAARRVWFRGAFGGVFSYDRTRVVSGAVITAWLSPSCLFEKIRW